MTQRRVVKDEDEEFIDLTSNGGLLKKIITEGHGVLIPSTDVIAIVHYTGKLTTGEIFDSSIKRGKPFEFNIGKREGKKFKDYPFF